MRRTLSDADSKRLDGLIAETEKRTGAQIILAVIKRSDSYAELPWKAFALGVSIAGLLILILDLLLNNWYPIVTALLATAGILAGGAVFALLTVLIPGFARRFLSADRADVEVQQYAESLFLDRELFTTSKRTGILILVSLFEREVVILPDKGLSNRLTEKTLQSVIASMTPFLKRNEVNLAFETGLDRLSQILRSTSPGTQENELPDAIIEEEGA